MAKKELTKTSEPTKPAEEVPKAEASQIEARQAVDEILRQAETKAASQHLEVDEKMKFTEALSSASQADYLPGGRYGDLSYIPEFVYDDGGVKRRVTYPNEYKYEWSSVHKIAKRKIYGFRFIMYKPTFSGTGLFEERADGHVWNGDVVLMACPMRAYFAYKKEIDELKEKWEGAAEVGFANEAYRHGVRSFREVAGETIWN